MRRRLNPVPPQLAARSEGANSESSESRLRRMAMVSAGRGFCGFSLAGRRCYFASTFPCSPPGQRPPSHQSPPATSQLTAKKSQPGRKSSAAMPSAGAATGATTPGAVRGTSAFDGRVSRVSDCRPPKNHRARLTTATAIAPKWNIRRIESTCPVNGGLYMIRAFPAAGSRRSPGPLLFLKLAAFGLPFCRRTVRVDPWRRDIFGGDRPAGQSWG